MKRFLEALAGLDKLHAEDEKGLEAGGRKHG